MPRRYLSLQGRYPKVIDALNFPLDISPLASFTEASDTLTKDLPRTHFFSDKLSFAEFCRRIKTSLTYSRCYLQGDLDGGIIAKSLMIHNAMTSELMQQYDRLPQEPNNHTKEKKKEHVQQMLREITGSDIKGVRLAYLTDKKQLNGLAIAHLNSHPDVFSIAVIENIDSPPHKRNVHLFAYYRLFPNQGNNVIPFKEITLSTIKEALKNLIDCETLLYHLKDFISLTEQGERVAGINQDALARFKDHSLPGQNYSDFDERVAQKNSQEKEHFEIIEKLTLLAKCILSREELALFNDNLTNQHARNKITLSYNDIERSLSKAIIAILDDFVKDRAILVMEHQLKMQRLKKDNEEVIFQLQTPFLVRRKNELIALSLSTLMTSLGLVTLLSVSASLSLIGLILIGSFLASTGLGVAISSLSLFHKESPKLNYFRALKDEKNRHQENLKTLHKERLLALKKEPCSEEPRVKLLELIASKSIALPMRIIDNYLTMR